jgi:predicted nucleic acid-binding protein
MRVYVDTNIIVDLLVRDLPQARTFFEETIRCKHTLVVSHHTLTELTKIGIDCTTLIQVLKICNKFVPCDISDADILTAKSDHNTHVADALHIVLCKKSNADCLLTANIKDFSHFSLAMTYDDI